MEKAERDSFLALVWAVIFVAIIPKAQVTKAKIDKRDCIKLKSFSTTKDTMDRVKGRPVEWEKMGANHTPGKGLISYAYKKLNTIAR